MQVSLCLFIAVCMFRRLMGLPPRNSGSQPFAVISSCIRAHLRRAALQGYAPIFGTYELASVPPSEDIPCLGIEAGSVYIGVHLCNHAIADSLVPHTQSLACSQTRHILVPLRSGRVRFALSSSRRTGSRTRLVHQQETNCHKSIGYTHLAAVAGRKVDRRRGEAAHTRSTACRVPAAAATATYRA